MAFMLPLFKTCLQYTSLYKVGEATYIDSLKGEDLMTSIREKVFIRFHESMGVLNIHLLKGDSFVFMNLEHKAFFPSGYVITDRTQ